MVGLDTYYSGNAYRDMFDFPQFGVDSIGWGF
nr:MAG TPA: hypothetical protein [Caudoviricetes sp.]